MVLSKIDSSISYPELKKMYDEDSKMESTLYEIEVHGVDIIIAVGNARKDFENKGEGVLFYPIYLVKTNNKVVQIGVYEIVANQLLKYLDDDNNIDVEKLNDPLIFKFVTKTMLEKERLLPEVEEYEENIEESEKEKSKEKEDAESEDEESEEESDE